MNNERANRILKALGEMGTTQMLITDPLSIYYLTGVLQEPMERFYCLLLKKDAAPLFFINRLFFRNGDTDIRKLYFDDGEDAVALLCRMSEEMPNFSFLGNYSEL